MKKARKHKKFMRTVIALLLVISLVLCNTGTRTVDVVEASDKMTYISDVQLFQAETLEQCVSLCESVGYIPYRQNLNDGAIEKVRFGFDTAAPCVLLGYKTTSVRELAVTDLSVMEMGTGYLLQDYQSMAASLLAKNQGLAEGLAASASEFADNYRKGAPASARAYQMMNLMYVDDLDKHSFSGFVSRSGNSESYEKLIKNAESLKPVLEQFDKGKMLSDDESDHEPLGDYILKGNADAEFFSKLLAFGTPSINSSVISALCAGSAEYLNYYDEASGQMVTKPWAERISSSDVLTLMNEGLTTDDWKKLDSLYMDSARQLATQLQSYTTLYLNARARSKDTIQAPDSEGVENLRDVADSMSKLQEKDFDAIFICAYKILCNYSYSEGVSLGDWIIRMGQKSYSSEKDYRQLYALADVISPSQLISIRYSGFATFVNTMLQCEDAGDETEQLYQEIVDSLKSLVEEGEEYRVSVWLGVDSSIYRGKVALTNDAIRTAAANKEFQRTSGEGWAEFKSLAMKWVAIGTGALGLVSATLYAFVYFKGLTLAEAGGAAAVASCGGFWGGAASLSATLSSITWWLIVAEVVIALGIYIYGLVQKELHVPSSDYTEMPTIVYESKATAEGNVLARYDAVWEPFRGRIGDLNAYEGNRWNCLFISHDAAAGSPLVLDADGNCFCFKQNDSVIPDGYAPCPVFGQLAAADMNSNAYDRKNDAHNYLFFRTEASLKTAENNENSQEQNTEQGQSTSMDGMYIADLYLATDDTENRARAKVTTKAGGYYLFDQNLGSEKKPAYLGYSLTPDKSKAITDIRVLSKESDPVYSFGNATYTCVGAMPNGDGVYISHSDQVGTPVHAEMKRVDDPKDIPEGWEPVVYFSGAPVYLFGDTTRFPLYFEPEVKYTKGTPYLGGIWFFTGLAQYDDNDRSGTMSRFDFSDEYESFREYFNWQEGGIADTSAMARRNGTENAFVAWSKYLNDNDFNTVRNLASEMYADERTPGSVYNSNVEFYTHARYLLYMGYTITYNPHRALHDIGLVTTGSVNKVKLMQGYSKGKTVIRNGVEMQVNGGYVPCERILSRKIEKEDSASRTAADHAFKTDDLGGFMYPVIRGKAVETPTVGFDLKWNENGPLLLQGLYVMGPAENSDPLLLSDVILTDKAADSMNKNGNITATMPSGVCSLDGVDRSGSTYNSVQDLKFPYNLKAQNLGYPSVPGASVPASDSLYIYLRREVRKPTYIASVTVGGYSEEQFANDNPSMKDDKTLKALEMIADESSWKSAMAGSNAEIIPVNLGVEPAKAWYGTPDATSKTAAYLGVSRTDNPDNAITGLLLVKRSGLGTAKYSTAAPKSIKVGGNTEYFLAEGSYYITMNGEDYFLYCSTNRAATPGSPITEISVDDMPLINGASTALCADKKGTDAAPYGDPKLTNYIHCAYKGVGGTYINKLYVGKGETYKAALADLLTQGCSEGCITDISRGNKNVTAKTVIGFRTFSPEDGAEALHKKKIGTTADPLTEAIRDVIFVKEGDPKEEILLDNVVYRLVSSNSICFSGGVYMYACMDYYTCFYNQKNGTQLPVPSMYSDYASPITKLGLALGDRVPYNTSLDGMNAENGDNRTLRWENALTDKRERFDLNYSVILKDSDGFITDNRVYLFLHREDNSVKKGSEITGGFVTDTETAGVLYGADE